jgi:hypothetical protein
VCLHYKKGRSWLFPVSIGKTLQGKHSLRKKCSTTGFEKLSAKDSHFKASLALGMAEIVA